VIAVGGGADVTVDGVQIAKGLNGVTCGGAAAKLKLRRSRITDAKMAGGSISACTPLLLDRHYLSGHNTGALKNDATDEYTVTNQVIVKNTLINDNQAVLLTGNAGKGRAVFRFNTIADNQSGNGVPSAIFCEQLRTIEDTIIFGNSPLAMMQTQIGGSCK